MKKFSFLFSLLFGLLCVACSSDDDDNGSPDTGGKKYLAEISINEYEWKFGERSSYGPLYELYQYNEKGLLTHSESHHYSSLIGGRFDDSMDYTYDEKGRLIEKNDYDFGLLQYKYKYEYNSFDSVSVMYEYDKKGSLCETHKYEYDNNRRPSVVTRRVNYISNNYGYVDTYEYNGNTVTITTTRLKDGSLFGKYVNEYDSHNNMVKSSWTDGETGKTSTSEFKYEYDSKGRISKKTSPYSSGLYEKYEEYSYNEDGTIHIKHVSYSDNNDQSDLEYTYTYK